MRYTDDDINKYVNMIIHAKANANATLTPPQSSTKRIPRVRSTVSKTEYEKYYVPKVVSIGPYHFGTPELDPVEKLKPVFAEKIFEGKCETLKRLFKKLLEPQMVDDLGRFYDEDWTMIFGDIGFTYMMLLDACFILHYSSKIYFGGHNDYPELKSNRNVFAYQDLFLVENQIPLKVLIEVAKAADVLDLEKQIANFIYESGIVTPWQPKRTRWSLGSMFSIACNRPAHRQNTLNLQACDHLLHVLHRCLIHDTSYDPDKLSLDGQGGKCNYRNVSELVDVGVHFMPSSIMSLAHVEFSKGWLRFSASVKLPRIKVNGSTKHMLLNLITYEKCLRPIDEAWVTSYVGLLDSLIDNAEDVKILRKSWVLETTLGSDEQVAELFNEIGRELVSSSYAYSSTKNKIQKHYESWSNTLFSQLKNEYFKSPWAIFVLLGALLGLILTAIQTYSGLTGECDDLCKLLKKNHHL